MKISVILSVYNTEKYIRECLDSLIHQTINELEIIIVNDGSTDQSPQIIDEFAAKYSNIKVIHQENSGVSIANNNGIKAASGKYVILADSDDRVPLDAYEKLYVKAEETNADIVIGKGNLLIDGVEREFLSKKEKYVWQNERVINSIYDYLDLFYDVFYWNKLFRREFLIENQCYLPPGNYSDRPMVHKAFLCAKKIAIIPDVVYLWRKRSKTDAPSLSQKKSDITNFQERIQSYNYQLEYFKEIGDPNLTNEFLLRSLFRLLIPIEGIVNDPSFCEVFIKEVKKIFKQITDIYNNECTNLENLYIYLIQNDFIDELVELVKNKPTGKVIEENGVYYWNIPNYFRNNKLRIPDEIFKIKLLQSTFVKIESLTSANDHFQFNGVAVPNYFSIQKAEVEFQARSAMKESLSFELSKCENNQFSGEIPLHQLNSNETYDIYIIFSLDDKREKFRITKEMVLKPSKIKTSRFQLHFTRKNNLSCSKLLINIRDIEMLSDKLRIILLENQTSYQFLLKERRNKNTIYFKQTANNCFEMNWSSLAETNEIYDVYFQTKEGEYRLGVDQIDEFSPSINKQEDRFIATYETKKGNLSIGVCPPINITALTLNKDHVCLEANHNAHSFLEFSLKERGKKEVRSFVEEKPLHFICPLKAMLKKNTKFDVYFKVFNSEMRLSLDIIETFKSQIVSKGQSFIESYKTIHNNLSFRTAFVAPLNTPKINRQKLMITSERKVPASLKFFIKDSTTDEIYYLQQIDSQQFELEWNRIQLHNTKYDWYFEIFNHPFRLKETNIDDFIPSFRTIPAFLFLYETKKSHIAIKAQSDFSITEFQMDDKEIYFKLNDTPHAAMNIFLKDRHTRETINFGQKSAQEFVLKWQDFLKPNKEYDVYYEIFNKEIRLNADKIDNYIQKSVHYNKIYLQSQLTFKNDLYITSETFWSKIIKKWK